jgi:hypothetical protein
MAKMYTPPNPALNDYDDLIEYALTIDGYEYAEKVWGLDNTQDHWVRSLGEDSILQKAGPVAGFL